MAAHTVETSNNIHDERTIRRKIRRAPGRFVETVRPLRDGFDVLEIKRRRSAPIRLAAY